MNYIWVQEKSPLNVGKMEGIAAGKPNIELSCEAFRLKRGKSWSADWIHSSDKRCAIFTTAF
jgi:hypothetical protein